MCIRDSDEAVASLIGRYMYNDMPASTEGFGADRTYAATRANHKTMSRVAGNFDSIFGANDTPQTAAIAAALAASSQRYFSLNEATEPDPGAFRTFLEQSPAEAQTLAYIRNLESLLADLKGLGLTAVEYRQTRNRILSAVAPQGGLTVDQLARAIERPRGGV